MKSAILETKVENLNREVNGEFELDFAFGGVRLCEKSNAYGGLSDVSERMTNAQMSALLDTLYLLARKHNIKF